MDLTTCPECGGCAEVQWRAVLDSTDGPVEHAKIVCLQSHWFLLPIATLERGRPSTSDVQSAAPRDRGFTLSPDG